MPEDGSGGEMQGDPREKLHGQLLLENPSVSTGRRVAFGGSSRGETKP